MNTYLINKMLERGMITVNEKTGKILSCPECGYWSVMKAKDKYECMDCGWEGTMDELNRNKKENNKNAKRDYKFDGT